jgi:hypothetical protein
MARVKRFPHRFGTGCILAQLGCLAALAVLAGCPSPSQVTVTPLAVFFGASDGTHALRIANQGVIPVHWEVSEDLPWLELSLPGDPTPAATLEGTLETGVILVNLTVIRSELPVGQTTTGQVTVTTDAGVTVVSVSASAEGVSMLQLSPASLDFGASDIQSTLYVSNTGLAPLNWAVAVPTDAPWVTVTPSSGTIASGDDAVALTVTVSRSGLAGASFSTDLQFTSDGGDVDVPVAMLAPSFTVAPATVDFGNPLSTASRPLIINNAGFEALDLTLTIQTGDGGAWLSSSQSAVTLPASGSVTINITANPQGLTPNTYSGSIHIANGTTFAQDVPVQMLVTGFGISPTLVPFGTITSSAAQSVQLQNLGTTSIPWSVAVTPASAWLSLDHASGTLQSADSIQLTADPTRVTPGQYTATLTFSFSGIERTVTVTMAKPRPASLQVSPADIDFAATGFEYPVFLWNDGVGAIAWSIDTTGFPAWLTLTPVNAQGVASGTVSGDTTDQVALSVRRDLAPAGQTDFDYTFTVQASGDSATPVPVAVHMTVPPVPSVELQADGLDSSGVPFVNLDSGQTQKTFTITNTGTGTLTWSVDLSAKPAWLVSVDPQQGALNPGIQETITVTVTRTGLSYLGAQYVVPITTDDPEHTSLKLLIEVQVPKVISIGTDPSTIAFGLNDNSAALGVANFGDPDTVLNFQLVPTKDWLAVYPSTGSSVGVSGAVKDWKDFSVSVDRSLLEGQGASAKIVISAFDVVDGKRVIRTDVTPVQVPISVEANELTIENALPRLRVPSLVRFVLTMRDVQYRSIALPETVLPAVNDEIAVFEKSVPLELTETNQFLTPINRGTGTLLILLDYSGSMQAAAQQVTDPDVVAAPDRLSAVYQKTIGTLIDEIPANYRLGIAVFNERGYDKAIRVIKLAKDDADFETNRANLHARLNSIQVTDNGATELLPAVEAASALLEGDDFTRGLLAFDNADVRGVVCVTDGRLTTPPGTISEAVTTLLGAYTRFLCVGWGSDVLADPLIRLANGTGGHFYSTKTVAGSAIAPETGTVERIPVVDSLLDWCQTNVDDPCDQSISKDLAAQVVFSYVTLSDESGVLFEGRPSFNDPNDQNSPCIPEQGVITGSWSVGSLDYSAIAGDPRLGQISLRSTAIQPDGTAIVRVYLDYAPRNISTFTLNIDPGATPMAVEQVQTPDGGLIPGWQQTVNGTEYTFTAPAGTELPYGAFGDLLELHLSGIADPYELDFGVTSPVYNKDDLNGKYFICPQAIVLSARDSSYASSFPEPAYRVIGPDRMLSGPPTYEMGATINNATVQLANIGGQHLDTKVWLGWTATVDSSSSSYLSLSPAPATGTIKTLMDPVQFNVLLTRPTDPGDYEGIINLAYTFGSLNMNVTGPSIHFHFAVTLAVTPTTLDFGTNLLSLPLTVTNGGGAQMKWAVSTTGAPAWLTVQNGNGTLAAGASAAPTITIDRTGLAAGTYSAPIVVTADDGSTVSVNVTFKQQ